MTFWLIYYRDYVDKNHMFINNVINTGKSLGVTIELVYVEDIINNDFEMLNSDRLLPDAVIARMINPELSTRLENARIKVFNNADVAYICNNKAETCRHIHKLGIEHIPSLAISCNSQNVFSNRIGDRHILYEFEYIDSLYNTKYGNKIFELDEKTLNSLFNNKESLLINNKNTSSYVIKSVSGHGGKEVMTLEQFLKGDAELGKQESDAANYYKDKFVIQPLINANGRDLRVYVLGHEIIGAVLRKSVYGFKSNYSLGGSVSLYELSTKQKNIVNRIIDAFDFSYVGIDFLLDENENLIFNEIEDVVGSRMLSACSNINYVGLYLKYILSNLE